MFNFELPHQAEIYVHRIGRTARGGRKGVAISLVADREMSRLRGVENERGTGAMKLWRADSMDDSASKLQKACRAAVYLEINGAQGKSCAPEHSWHIDVLKELSADAVEKSIFYPW